jgi:hypothetical protein
MEKKKTGEKAEKNTGDKEKKYRRTEEELN